MSSLLAAAEIGRVKKRRQKRPSSFAENDHSESRELKRSRNTPASQRCPPDTPQGSGRGPWSSRRDPLPKVCSNWTLYSLMVNMSGTNYHVLLRYFFWDFPFKFVLLQLSVLGHTQGCSWFVQIQGLCSVLSSHEDQLLYAANGEFNSNWHIISDFLASSGIYMRPEACREKIMVIEVVFWASSMKDQ